MTYRIFRPTTTTRHVYDVAAQHVVKVLWEGSMNMLSLSCQTVSNANVVGLALAEKHLAARFNKPDKNEIVDHYTGFSEYVESGAEPLYQTLCSEITTEFSECSKQVREMESQFLNPQVGRSDLAKLLSDIQTQEKQKLHMVLKKAGKPSERMLTHANCKFKKPMQHECVHLHEITEAEGTEEAEADAEFDNALKEAIRTCV
ncbi:unnamed protein product [Arabidopsis arenosa]|uniref:Uncharacterized protein n=1 Tax=Arabidopsis arenosa TaxID=38785 RepID=A0A8S2AI76_ARAAE|nr:unnamed protein product [Arabidopsis arenosa]